MKCNVHPWMHGWFAVLNTNHYAVSKGGGDFKLPNLPPANTPSPHGMRTTARRRRMSPSLATKPKTINFTFKAKAY